MRRTAEAGGADPPDEAGPDRARRRRGGGNQRAAERWSSTSPFETFPFIGLLCSSIFAFAVFNGTQPVIGVKDCAQVAVEDNNTETTLATNRIDLITSTPY